MFDAFLAISRDFFSSLVLRELSKDTRAALKGIIDKPKQLANK